MNIEINEINNEVKALHSTKLIDSGNSEFAMGYRHALCRIQAFVKIMRCIIQNMCSFLGSRLICRNVIWCQVIHGFMPPIRLPPCDITHR